MKGQRAPEELFALTRRFAAVSLIAVLVTAVALAALYRELSIRTIVAFGEQGNVTVARTLLNSMLPELVGYLRANESAAPIASVDNLPAGLLSLFRASVRDTPIRRIKIYNRNGIILYSTLEYENGTDDSANPRFQGSIRGQVRSTIDYRDTFNISHRGNGDDNLIETYVPVRQSGEPQPIGVLEIYTDVEPIVLTMSQNALLILMGIGSIMLILYGFLLFVVHRAEKIVAGQRQTILERNRTLEVLSARMLHAEEAERNRVAWELHEEIAQTLSAVKIKIDALASANELSQSSPASVRGEEIVPLLQSAIGDVRALAMDLRPANLDDFGLIAATRSLCSEADQVRGQLRVTADIAVREEEVPDLLKGVIFRITQETMKRLVRAPDVSDIQVALRRRGEGLQLVFEFSAETGETANGETPASSSEEGPLTNLWERAVLAGGSFSTSSSAAGRFSYQATWIV